MEQLRHSEEKIIKLGEKIIKELDLEYSRNTLARWMSHYIAELIEKIEESDVSSNKELLKKECCDTILKLWNQKDVLPIDRPINKLRPLIEVLEVLKNEKDRDFMPQYFFKSNIQSGNNDWAKFIYLVKNNSVKIFNQTVRMSLVDRNTNTQEEKWMFDNKEFYDIDEIDFFDNIGSFIDYEKEEDNKKLIDRNTQINSVFENLENLIDEQKEELMRIKTILLGRE